MQYTRRGCNGVDVTWLGLPHSCMLIILPFRCWCKYVSYLHFIYRLMEIVFNLVITDLTMRTSDLTEFIYNLNELEIGLTWSCMYNPMWRGMLIHSPLNVVNSQCCCLLFDSLPYRKNPHTFALQNFPYSKKFNVFFTNTFSLRFPKAPSLWYISLSHSSGISRWHILCFAEHLSDT